MRWTPCEALDFESEALDFEKTDLIMAVGEEVWVQGKFTYRNIEKRYAKSHKLMKVVPSKGH